MVTAARFTIACLLVVHCSIAVAEPPASIMRDHVDPAAQATFVFEMQSKSGREYRIFVSKPESPAPKNGYEVIYAVDGNAYFGPMVDARNASRKHRDEMVVVGIGYPIETRIDMKRRTYDLTPPADESKLPPRRGGVSWPEWGGASEFLTFIDEELKPEMERRVSINRDRQSIFGHSFGGLFVLHAAFTRPDSFQTFVAASPSVWWNDYSIEQSPIQPGKKLKLLVTVGDLEMSGDKGPAASLAPTEAKREFGTIEDYAKRLKTREGERLALNFNILDGASHGDTAEKTMQLLMQSLSSRGSDE